jgi:hypothetical protein
VGSPSCVLEELTTTELCGQLDAEVSEACDTCSKDACCAEERGCQDSASCTALFACLGPCESDPECIAGCAQEHPSDDAAQALSLCHGTNCLNACSTCGGFLAGVEPSCDDCLRTSCCDVISACSADLFCAEILQCVATCTQPDCAGNCRAGSVLNAPDPDVPQELYRDVESCAVTTCQAACDLGIDWSCVGQFDYMGPEVDSFAFENIFTNLLGTAVPDLTVKGCGPLDVACADPLATETTDASGKCVLELQTGTTGFTGFLEVTGADRVPLLAYVHVPITGDRQQTWFSLSPAELGTLTGLSGGGTPDPARGHLAVRAFDCRGANGLGLRFDVGEAADSDSHEFYFVNGVPSGETDKTTGEGLGGWFDITPGTVTVQAFQEDSVMPVATKVVQVRAGALTITTMSADAR